MQAHKCVNTHVLAHLCFMKKFSTYGQQLELLKSRNLIISNETFATEVLINHGYYNLINGYKDIFLHSRNNETYITNTKFSDIFELYSFDKKLRNRTLNNILEIETFIKAIIAHELAEISELSYLDPTTYETRNPKQANKVSGLIMQLKNTIKDKASLGNNAISHYIGKYGNVPIWVSINFFTLGNISYLYSLLTNSIKIKIVTAINQSKNLNLTTREFSNYLSLLTFARNECAHNQRIYNFSTKITLSQKNTTALKILNTGVTINLGLEMLFIVFHDFLEHPSFVSYVEEFVTDMAIFSKGFPTIALQNLLATISIKQTFIIAIVDTLI